MALLNTLAGAASLPLTALANGNAAATMAIDCHAHVFMRNLPMPDKRRAPSGYDAPPELYLNQLQANSMTHGVLIQPSFLGTDNSYLLQAMQAFPGKFRAIAVVDPSIGAAELDAMDQAGVVGIRLNQIGLPVPDFKSADWQRVLAALKRRNWQVEVHQLAAQLPELLDPLLAHGLNVVVDHFGRPDPKLGVDDPGFRYLLEQGKSGRLYVKISGAYRNGSQGRGEQIALQAMPLLKAALGLDHLLWGSDWPHTLFEKTASYAAQRQLLDSLLPDQAERQQVLGASAKTLFRF